MKGNILYLLSNYPHDRSPVVVLNGQCSIWKFTSKRIGIGQRLFLICINNLADQISSASKIFKDYTSLFSPVYCN